MTPPDAHSRTGQGGIRKQVVLPFGKSLRISIQSLRVRFFRNCVTVMTLVLAVAFLAFILISADIASGLLESGGATARQMLIRAGYDLAEDALRVGSSPKDHWIVGLSLLVCTVGIVNAQLMSVTERFREIGTMKCLGALDSFILRLFLLEASVQGVIGAAAGCLLGALAAISVGMIRFGFPALTSLPVTEAFASLALSAVVGLVLSMIGVLYPAIIAARMQPVEAMRAEE